MVNGLGSIHRLQEEQRIAGPTLRVERLLDRLMKTILEKDTENALLRDEIHALREQLNRESA